MRERWLEDKCGGDIALRQRLEQLVRFAEDGLSGLEPAGALGDAVAAELGIALGSARAAPALVAGQPLGRYEIRGLLGSGGMSRVYRAFDPVLGREVAIKALAEAFRDDAASLRRFQSRGEPAQDLLTLVARGLAGAR